MEETKPEFDSHSSIYTATSAMPDLAKAIYEINKSKGFWEGEVTDHNTGEKLMLMVSELAEGLEADRKGKHADLALFEDRLYYWKSNFSPEVFEDQKMKGFKELIKDTLEDELADAVIRIFDYCGAHKIDIGKHIYYKLEYNVTRPFKHGKKY